MTKVFSFIKKNLKWFVLAAGLVAIVVMGGVLSNSKKKNHDYKVQIEALESEIADKNQLIEKLAALEAIRCEVSITVKNTAVMGSNKSGNISQDAEQIATYLREELINDLKEK